MYSFSYYFESVKIFYILGDKNGADGTGERGTFTRVSLLKGAEKERRGPELAVRQPEYP